MHFTQNLLLVLRSQEHLSEWATAPFLIKCHIRFCDGKGIFVCCWVPANSQSFRFYVRLTQLYPKALLKSNLELGDVWQPFHEVEIAVLLYLRNPNNCPCKDGYEWLLLLLLFYLRSHPLPSPYIGKQQALNMGNKEPSAPFFSRHKSMVPGFALNRSSVRNPNRSNIP